MIRIVLFKWLKTVRNYTQSIYSEGAMFECREDDQFEQIFPIIYVYQKNNTSTRSRVSYMMNSQCPLGVMIKMISKN